MEIGFIGLGNMGMPMAKNLAAANLRITGFDSESVRKENFNIVNSIESACSNKDIIITMLPNGKIVKKVYKKIISIIRPETITIDCSTVDIITSKWINSMSLKHNVYALDAPVSGGVIGAENGTLTFMVGGESSKFEKAKKVFDIMGSRAIFCGDPGSGQATKICNNLIVGISMIGVCEAFALAEKLDLNKQKVFDVISTSSGQCWSINSYCPIAGVGPKTPADNKYKPGFSSELMLKDLKLARSSAKENQVKIPLTNAAHNLYQAFVNSDGKGKDFSAILNFLNKL